MVKKTKSEKSKRNAFIPHMMECAYYTEKTRRDYLRKCSEHFNKLLYDCLVDSKCWWMKCEDDQVELEKSGNEHVADYIKNGVLRRKLYPVLHEVLGPKKQKKKKKKKCSKGGQPPKKQDLPRKACVERLTRSGAKSIDTSAAAE